MSFSSFDVREMVEELQEVVGMRCNTVYQIGNLVRIKLFGKGRKDLAITNEAFYNTRYPRQAPQKATNFAMLLRKYLKGCWLYQINQVNFDRVVEFHFGYSEESHFVLVAELFGKGNIILHSHNEIIGVLRKEKWKDRILYPHKEYSYPPTRLSIDLPLAEFEKLNIQTEKDLAVNFNLGNLYAREVFLRAKSPSAEDLYEALHSFEKNPNILENNSVLPYDLLVYKDCEKEFFPTFTEAVDEFYRRKEDLSVGEETESQEDKILRLQKEAIKDFEAKRDLYKTCGDLIYQNYTLVEDVLKTLMEARKTHPWEEIISIVQKSDHKIAQKIMDIDYRNAKVVVGLSEPVTLDLTLNINENAADYYERAKKMERKIEGAKKAMKKPKKIEKVPLPKRTILRKREWFEKFHWCLSSEGHLILGGRDTRTNELLVKKYMEPTDVYVHADIQGATSVVVKKGKEASTYTLEEAAQFAAAYSRAWNHFGSLECYWVNPEQVTKSPPSGEYLTPGAFFIAGSKNFMKVDLGIALGLHDDKIMGGPESAVKTHTSAHVVVGFGDEKKERLAKQIGKILDYPDIDEIIRALPGKGRILSRK
ncbi:MAG: NFACT family protein [Theionarchaea archaeon]|nr:NFACT family protein [Theionarchaea archaeon]MBU7000398.1 NFACT family protein [Theionarchaea archaeon]MBU7021240.1 NFACT family protein [Theionarchaea archaeon]MBU7036006.1 NFACT family protein [Theionarchaea archaeon]MBU7039732.1 NFACT family protein [Theionarchaea archaeon]